MKKKAKKKPVDKMNYPELEQHWKDVTGYSHAVAAYKQYREGPADTTGGHILLLFLVQQERYINDRLHDTVKLREFGVDGVAYTDHDHIDHEKACEVCRAYNATPKRRQQKLLKELLDKDSMVDKEDVAEILEDPFEYVISNCGNGVYDDLMTHQLEGLGVCLVDDIEGRDVSHEHHGLAYEEVRRELSAIETTKRWCSKVLDH